jgi:hypothetical protein
MNVLTIPTPRELLLMRDAVLIADDYGPLAPPERFGNALRKLGPEITTRLKERRWQCIYQEFSATWCDLGWMSEHPLMLGLASDWEPS